MAAKVLLLFSKSWWSNLSSEIRKVFSFCVKFPELSHLTRDLSQAKEKINDKILFSLKMTTYWNKSQDNSKSQHRKWGPKWPGIKLRWILFHTRAKGARARANSSKNHTLLMCKTWKMGRNLFSSLDIRDNFKVTYLEKSQTIQTFIW